MYFIFLIQESVELLLCGPLEENVYLLCKNLCMNGAADTKGSDLFIVFLTNEKKQVPLWHQKAGMRADGLVLWDYHVICIQRKKEENSPPLVWDLDSNLPFPSPLASYLSETIRPSFHLFAEFQRLFRIVHAPIFFRFFASDRRHMKDSVGNWIAQPPAYEPIVAEDGTLHNLNEYLEVEGTEALTSLEIDSVNAVYTEKLGVLVSQSQLEELFTLIS
ncbi:protein N-terminal glutamine amidohydrolase isoform X1 [Malania oleifera]|uniref:protein N-terminal glutamine amidohydrolase isoform X1 n=1 Tax=Malania oleifera TaxID=397392 RepID=UPI0025ADD58C|nr:protein N-terminal glutamine amidohydrolase isoform X1 [Malania oleifera]